jgi:drug/metabolite transporter (DMT)-like permease
MTQSAGNGRAWLPVVVLLFGASLWGVVWWPLKYFRHQGLGDAELVLYAYGLVAVVTAPVLWRQRHQWRSQWRLLVLLALLGGYANLAFVTALSHGQVIRVMMLFYLAPVWGVLGARVFLGEPIGPTRALAVALAVGGAAIMLAGPGALSGGISLMDVLALTSGMAFATNNVTCRAAQEISVMGKAAAVFAGCAVLAGVLVGVQGTAMPVMDAGSWVWLALFALLWLLAATFATQYGVTHMQAGRASVLLLTELLAAVATAMLAGGEVLSLKETLGGALILTAAVLEARSPGAADPAAAIPAGR